MNIEELYSDYNIDYVTEGHKHAREGWVNTECPFCTGEHAGYHLGYDTYENKFVCWRCGGSGKYPVNVIQKLLNVTKQEAYTILKKYEGYIKHTIVKKRKIQVKSFKYPSNLIELGANHRQYLIKRGFDPDKLIMEWYLLGTGPVSLLQTGAGKFKKDLNYKHRIIIPFMWDNKIVSFDSRDITNKAENKYMACPEDREIIPHKHILYGRPDKWGLTGICVEGPTDVWRLGYNSFATSGIKFTMHQIRQIAKQFKRVPVIFDNDPGNPQAQIQAKKLIKELNFRKVDAFQIEINGDPGDMSQSEADYLVKQLI